MLCFTIFHKHSQKQELLKNMKEITIPKIETEAKEFLKIKKSKNETTYKNYKTSLNYFIYYLKDIAKTTEINEINKYKLLEGFQAALYEGFTYTNAGKTRPVKVKANGTNTHIRRIKTFLKTIGMETKIPNLKVSKPEYKALKPEDIKLLINETNNKFNNKEIAVRTSVLIQFLFNTALRIEEALNIKTTDFYSENNNYFVLIHEKGKAKEEKTRVVISNNTAKLLNDYMDLKKVPSDYIFSSIKSSRNGKAKKLPRETFNKNIRELAAYTDIKHNTNITKTIRNNSSHVFRHSKARYLLTEAHEDVITVQKVLRHESINSTLIYLNPEEEAINNVRKANDII